MRIGVERRQVVGVGQTIDLLGRQVLYNGGKGLVFAAVAGPVEFEIPKEQQQAFKVSDREPVVYGIQGVGDDVEDTRLLEIGGQVENVLAALLDLVMLGFGDVQYEHVDLAAVLREVAGHLLADEGVGQVRNLQGPADTVVVGDGHGSRVRQVAWNQLPRAVNGARCIGCAGRI